jgi:hypothetical protein
VRRQHPACQAHRTVNAAEAKEAKVGKKKSGRLNRGPFTCKDFQAALKLGGWLPEKGTKHLNYSHPNRAGRRVQIDHKWTAVKVGHFTFTTVAEQAGYTKEELLLLLNGVALD